MWHSLDSVFGAGSFNDENEGAFYAPKSCHALALKSERGRLQQARNDAVAATGLVTHPATNLDANAVAFGHRAVKPHTAIFNEIRL